MKVCPAMVSTADRVVPVFAVAVTVTVPEPVPLAGLTDAQEEVPSAVQPQLGSLAVTVTVVEPPAVTAVHEVADNEYVQVGVPPVPNVNRLDRSLWPEPDWPTAATRAL